MKGVDPMAQDSRALAYVNMFGVLGALAPLCRLVPEASALIADKKISVGMTVKNGPSATFLFDHGTCTVTEGITNCDIKLPFSSCEKFNGLIDGTTTPIPSKGFLKIGFLLKVFTKLTDLLPKYLRAEQKDLEDPDFFRKSTLIMLELIGNAIVQLGNEDKVSRFSASNMIDGDIKLGIRDEVFVYIRCRDHKLSLISEAEAEPAASMIFDDIQLARALFDGQVNALACIGTGRIRISGMIPQMDNINRILDRVALYLA